MALKDKPQIDPSAANSSLSERKLQDWFNESTGFILRKEQPDKGCDYMCEMLEGTGATNWKFPIQLKSIQQPTIVDNDAYISYPMLTSRLGYMLNQLPTTGIIVFYAVDSHKLFCEFSDKIYNRIKSDRDSDYWTKQESVNIRIPLANVLTTASIKDIHTELLERFRNAARMQAAHGASYQLPLIEIAGDDHFDWNNPEHIRKWLRQYGQAMLFRFDLAPVYESLTRLRITEIENDKELLLVACVAYCETGHCIESDLFTKKIREKFELNEAEMDTIEIVEARNKQQMGQLTPAEFIRLLERQVLRATDKQNKLSARINLQRVRIASVEGSVPMPTEITIEVYAIYQSIEQSELDQNLKDTLALWNAEHESHLLTHQQHLDYISFQMIRTTGRNVPRSVWEPTVNAAMEKEMQLLKRVEQIGNRAVTKENKFLEATANFVLGNYALQKFVSLTSYPDSPIMPEELMKQFMRYGFMAYRLFREIGHPVDSYRSLCTTLELMYVTKYYYDHTPEEYIQVLLSDKETLENQIMISPYQLQLPARLEKNKAMEQSGVNDSLAEYPDADLENLAQLVFSYLRLPQDRFINFHNEYIATRMFQQRCTNPNIQFFCYNYGSAEHTYSRPVQYVLKNKISSIESPLSTDMNSLLSAWGF